MEYKKAADVLVNILKNRDLKTEEKEALSEAIGVLAWVYLYKNRIKSIMIDREQ
jgi:hypothetical protein